MTAAMRARKLLSQGGISAKLVKINPIKSASGCTYGLRISPVDFYGAVVVLKNKEINYSLYSDG